MGDGPIGQIKISFVHKGSLVELKKGRRTTDKIDFIHHRPKLLMALFSFRHSVKTFSEKREREGRKAEVGQTAGHLRYITRPKAASVIVRERVCSDKNIEVAKAVEDEAQRKKGRVCERFCVALPIEATPQQKEALVRAFGEALTEGKAGYIAAIHDQHGNDVSNPHFHMAAFDHYVRNGGRGRPRSTLGMARKNAVERTAKLWADTHNRLMAEWGYGRETRIDHRSYAERGIDQIPQIHEGPASKAMAEKSIAPESKEAWRKVDDGHTRAEANEVIKEINKMKETENDKQDDRLGSGDERDSARRTSDRENDGERDDCVEAGDRQSTASIADEREDDGRTSANNGEPSRPPFLSGQNPGASGTGASTLPPFLAAGRLRRRRGVRRIFRELVMLRDSLRARLRRGNPEARRARAIVQAKKEMNVRRSNDQRIRDRQR